MKINQTLLDLGPLLAFLIAYYLFGKDMMLALPVIMITTLISLALSYIQNKKIRIMPLITMLMVMIFGGLALYFDNPVFFMIKPTIIYVLFAVALGGGMMFGQYFLKLILESSFQMPEKVWAKLTWRWAGFFLVLAALNEFVWRSFGEEIWVNFKVMGFLPLTFLFAMANMPLMMKYMVQEEETPTKKG
jgi:intracellular septation protein